MRNLILTLALVCGFVFTSQAQNAKGDFYVGTVDITEYFDEECMALIDEMYDVGTS